MAVFLVIFILLAARSHSSDLPCDEFRTREGTGMPILTETNWVLVKVIKGVRTLYVYKDTNRPDLVVAALKSVITKVPEINRVALMWEIGDERYITRPALDEGVCVNFIDRNRTPVLDLSNFVRVTEENF